VLSVFRFFKKIGKGRLYVDFKSVITYTLASILIKNNNKINHTMCVEIKQGPVDVWSGLQQNIVDSAVSRLRKRV